MLKTISGWTILTCRTRRLTCTFEKCTNRPHHHPEQSRSWHSMENQPTHSRWLDIIRRVHQVKVIVWKVKCKWQFKHEQNSPKIIGSHRDLQRKSVKSHFHRWWPLIIKIPAFVVVCNRCLRVCIRHASTVRCQTSGFSEDDRSAAYDAVSRKWNKNAILSWWRWWNQMTILFSND